MTAILGISAYYHDSAAAIVVDGEIVAAAQEERFSRIRHDASFPNQALEYCLQEANLTVEQLDHVAFYEKPFLKFERLLETYLAFAPRGLNSFLTAMPIWLRSKLYLSKKIQRELEGKYNKRILFPEHHESHAASAFFPSPFEDAAILTVDGVGEWASSTLGMGSGNHFEIFRQMQFPHSLGLLYSAFTVFCGFRVNSGEAKLMGLAPYGRPRYVELIRDKLIDLKDDGSFRLDLSYFSFPHQLKMTSSKFAKLFGGPARIPESELTQRELDIAASIQHVSEEILLRMVQYLFSITETTNLCIAGGVGLNCVANGKIRRDGPFANVWIQPAAGDAGGALGAALFSWFQLLDHPRTTSPDDFQQGALLGPSFEADDLMASIRTSGLEYTLIEDESELNSEVAHRLCDQQVIGWFQGRMEFGPRALGNRSILADPRQLEMWSTINDKVKFREAFRPFGPAVLKEKAHDFFQSPAGTDSPYMLIADHVCNEKRNEQKPGLVGLEQNRLPLSSIPSVTHVDYSSRIQTVSQSSNARFYKLIKRFDEMTGCPMLINTSFNVRGEPIVCTPTDALECFVKTGLDAVVLGNYLVTRQKNQDNQ